MVEYSKELSNDTTNGTILLTRGVRGYSSQVFNDPETAWKLHQESHLIAWRGESDGDLRVDRFDARNLLEDWSLFRQPKQKRKRTASTTTNGAATGEGEDAVEKEQLVLHRLRFEDYAVTSEEARVVENQCPYQYTKDKHDQETDGEALEPMWNVPDHLVLPKTKKRHAILEATANKVREHPQLEVMLKVKLGTNATFRFLDVSHELHAYYCFLRDKNPQPVSAKRKNVRGVLLGEEYDDDSDEQDKEKPSRKHEDDTQEQRKRKAARPHR